MKAGRELDAKVAMALGWEIEGENLVSYWDGTDSVISLLPEFSTSWKGMGVLVEEARKQGIYLEYSHSLNGGYYGGAYSFENGEYQLDHSTEQAVPTAPHAVALVYLIAKGVIANA